MSAALAPERRIKAWSRYFVSHLSESARHFLTPGFWLAQGLLPRWLVCKLAGAIHRRYCPAGME